MVSLGLLHFIAALLRRCIKGSLPYLLFHVLRSLTGFCKTTSKQELAGRYLFYRASSETSQSLNNRTSLCMSAEEECSRSVGMQPGNYSHIRQLSHVFRGKPVISQLPTLIGAALTLSVFVWEIVVHISVHLWPLEPQPAAWTWKNLKLHRGPLVVCGCYGVRWFACKLLRHNIRMLLPFWPLVVKAQGVNDARC